jgi:1-deoxy-D-xylulose-5-phosphate synthase
MLDIPFMRCVPNMVVSAPMNEEELRNLMYTATLPENAGPFSIRYPRGNGVMPDWKKPFTALEIGKGRKLKDGNEVMVLTFGTAGNLATTAIAQLETDGIAVGHCDMRFVKPIDEALLHEVFAKYTKIVTVEDGTVVGGFGSAVLEFMAAHQYNAQVTMLGMPDAITEHGEQSELYAECGFDANSITKAIHQLLEMKLVS